MAPLLFLVLPIAFGLYFGDMLTPRGCWTPLRGIGDWRNEVAARDLIDLLYVCPLCSHDVRATWIHSLTACASDDPPPGDKYSNTCHCGWHGPNAFRGGSAFRPARAA